MTTEAQLPLVASYYTLAGAGLGTPSRFTLEARCRAAHAAGFSGLGLTVTDYCALRETHTLPEIRSVLDGAGCSIDEIEFIAGWLHDEPNWQSNALKVLEAAAELGAHHVNAGEFGAAAAPAHQVTAERFDAVCQLAQRFDVRVALEFLPWSPIPSLDAGWAIISAVGADIAGLLVDAFHFHHSSSSLDTLRSLPVGAVLAVQLDDGPNHIDGDLRSAALERLPPGAGDFDLVPLCRAVHHSNPAALFEVEIFAPEQHELTVDEAAQRAGRAANTVLKTARLS